MNTNIIHLILSVEKILFISEHYMCPYYFSERITYFGNQNKLVKYRTKCIGYIMLVNILVKRTQAGVLKNIYNACSLWITLYVLQVVLIVKNPFSLKDFVGKKFLHVVKNLMKIFGFLKNV